MPSSERESPGSAEPRAWLVDLDGTLYRPLPVKLAMGLELTLFGSRQLAAIRAFRKQHELMRDAAEVLTPSPFEIQLERAAAELSISSANLKRTVLEWMVQRPGKWIRHFARHSLLREIADFRASGGKTAIVSDYPASSKLKALGATDLFDCVVSNGEPDGPPRLKPWPDGYLLAAQRLELAPEHCLVVGDRKDADGEAARRAGMTFRWIGR